MGNINTWGGHGQYDCPALDGEHADQLCGVIVAVVVVVVVTAVVLSALLIKEVIPT